MNALAHKVMQAAALAGGGERASNSCGPKMAHGLARVVIGIAVLLVSTPLCAAVSIPARAPLPQHLHDTGLYLTGANSQIDPKNLAFSPQYPLWSDGARKRRWIYLPPGTAIDASIPDAWVFPVGTRLWKEFALDRPVETRFIERLADGSWRFGTYVWNAEGTDATLAPSDGIASLPTRAGYAIPGEYDCRACHEGAATPVLGFSALQLSADRDPLAPHAEARTQIDLALLAARGLIKSLPATLVSKSPRIDAASPTERAALGYLHGNCAHCHNHNGAPAPVDLTLAQSVVDEGGVERVLRSMLNAPSRFRGHGLGGDALLIAPGRPEASVLRARMRSRNSQIQMPPLGTQLLDVEALALLERWIQEQSPTPRELKP